MKRLLVPLVCLGLAPFASAFQLRSQSLPFPSAPTGYVSGAATQALIGQFTDDVVADGALLVGGDVQLLYAPQRVVSYSKTAGPFSSMTKVRLSESPGREGLIASTSTGLSLLKWNDATRQLTSMTVLADPDWADARELQSVSFDETETAHICALSTSGDRILTADWDGAGIDVHSVRTLDLTTPALALAGLNWNGDALLDLAYDDGEKLRIVSNTGFAYWGFANSCTHPQVLRLARTGTTDDLIWLSRNPSADEQGLGVVHSSDGHIDSVLFLGTATAERLTLADVDADGLEDLLVTRSDQPWSHVLYQQPSGPMMFWLVGGSGGEEGTSIDLTEAYDSCAGTPVVAGGDLDGDGDDDFLYASDSACVGQARVYFANGVDDEEIYVKFVKPWLYWAEFADWPQPAMPPGPDEDGSALLSIWPRGFSTKAPVNAATDLRVTVWTRAAAGDPIEPMRLVDVFVDASIAPVTIEIPRPSVNPLPRYIVVDFSFVQRDGAGVVVRSFPGWTGEIDRTVGIVPQYSAGPVTTGGIDRPPPPPSPPGNAPNP